MISRIDRRPRKNGKVSWRVRFWQGKDADGKPVKDSRTFHTKGEAENFVKQLNADRGVVAAPTVLTVGQYLNQWLTFVESTRTYGTHRRYRYAVAPIVAALGETRLDKLTGSDLELAYGALYETVSARTVRETHGAIRAALNRAVRQKLIPSNPALACELRASDTGEARVLDNDQVGALETAAIDSWVGVVIRLAIDTGARRGELAALRWSDLDAAGRIRIWQSLCERDDGTVFLKPTKVRTERRVSLSPATLAYLDAQKARQERDAALMGDSYRRDLDLIVAGPDGDFMRPSTLTKTVRRLAERIGLKGAGLHSIRHSHATLLLSAGAPLAAVSKRLGHGNPYTTAKIYSHALQSDEAKLADLWDAIRGRETQAQMGKNGELAHGHDRTSHQKPN